MFPEKNYTLGRGKLYFDNGTGQRYIGNTPSVKLTSSSESLDHFDSDNGVKQKDASVLLSLNRNGSFTTDQISPENLALFFLGSASVVSVVGATALTDTHTSVVLGNRYQIGATPSAPAGARGITNVVVTVSASAKTVDVDYTVDAASGGIVYLPTGSIVAGDDVDITYDTTTTTYNRVVTAGDAEITGSLLFVSTNPRGAKFDYFWPQVSLTPDGDFELKGDEWQQISFSFAAEKKDDNTEVVYINGRPGDSV
jgi:hypothetical protein